MSILVSIICTSYNHERYLRQCLDGFVMQKTNFEYEIIIHDDASTDSSQDIIKEYCTKYPNLFVPILQKENQYSKGVKIGATYMYPKARGKYIAECEGDDYWTDPFKLQKQVDFMEEHPDCSLCYHECKNIFENGFNGVPAPFGEIVKDEYNFNELLFQYGFQTATVLYKKEVVTSPLLCELREKKFSFGDTLLFISAAKLGRVMGINECMSVYRRVNQGVSSSIKSGRIKYQDTLAWISSIDLFNKDEEKTIIKRINSNILYCYFQGQCSVCQVFVLLLKLFFISPSDSLCVLLSIFKGVIRRRIRSIL